MSFPLPSSDFSRVLAELPMTCLDVGARRGFTVDLLPLAGAVDAVGFEPDAEECERLNAAAGSERHPWRSLRFVPAALGPAGSGRTLNLYRQRGCSSLLEADPELAKRFARGDYFELEGRFELETVPLDDAARRFGIEDAVYMKIDVQGYEDAVFASGPRLLADALVAIRTEVSFIPLYKNQPLFGDIAAQLRTFGFVPMGFEELHHWRRSTKVKHPFRAPGSIPHSRGQMVHGDVVFFRDPETLADDSVPAVERLIKAAALALTYGYVDHAGAILNRPAVTRHLSERFGFAVAPALAASSRDFARREDAGRRKKHLLETKKRLRLALGR